MTKRHQHLRSRDRATSLLTARIGELERKVEAMALTQADLDAAIAAVNQKTSDALARVNAQQATMQAASTTLQATIDSLNAKIAALGTGDFTAEVQSLIAVGTTLDTFDPAAAQAAPLSPSTPESPTPPVATTGS